MQRWQNSVNRELYEFLWVYWRCKNRALVFDRTSALQSVSNICDPHFNIKNPLIFWLWAECTHHIQTHTHSIHTNFLSGGSLSLWLFCLLSLSYHCYHCYFQFHNGNIAYMAYTVVFVILSLAFGLRSYYYYYYIDIT
jgi:hypothetical protein